MSDSTHFRRCHRCDTVNSADGELVTTCECCGKHLAPFYFFDESRAMGMADSNFYSSLGVRVSSELLPHKEYPPVWGLTVYWEP
ncbi:hypothetical protein Bb109J_c0956 [Bdellovibrio bacteriovorus]|nr:hypothetical protein Bb109J_c0956 [Bdellovibrio bacteriovorus]